MQDLLAFFSILTVLLFFTAELLVYTITKGECYKEL